MSSARTITTCGAAVNHLTYALTHLDRAQPAALRRPLGGVLRAAVEILAGRPRQSSTVGLSIVHALDIADALIDVGGE